MEVIFEANLPVGVSKEGLGASIGWLKFAQIQICIRLDLGLELACLLGVGFLFATSGIVFGVFLVLFQTDWLKAVSLKDVVIFDVALHKVPP